MFSIFFNIFNNKNINMIYTDRKLTLIIHTKRYFSYDSVELSAHAIFKNLY